MKHLLILLSVFSGLASGFTHTQNNSGEPHSLAPVFEKLVWSDEFDTDGPVDPEKWFHQIKLPRGGSWYNGELQHYTGRMDNSSVENGLLRIVAKKESYTDQGYAKGYTSARLNSKIAFQYGRVEIRAKMPTGIGTWPAIWLLNTNVLEEGGYWFKKGMDTATWPACGEIDMVEHWGYRQNYIQSAMHTPSSYGQTVNYGGKTIQGASAEFHVYSMVWTKEELIFSVDDVVYYTYHPEERNADTWPFDGKFYLLLNVAIQPSIEEGFTSSDLVVDYVRIYQ